MRGGHHGHVDVGAAVDLLLGNDDLRGEGVLGVGDGVIHQADAADHLADLAHLLHTEREMK